MRKEDTGFNRGGTRIGLGFANALNYVHQMYCLIQTNNEAKAAKAPGYLLDYARKIVTPRFNLVRPNEDLDSNLPVTERYFALAGEFASRAKENDPAWLEARITVFENLFEFINFFRGWIPSIRQHERHLWNVFTRGIEASLSRETSDQETPPNE